MSGCRPYPPLADYMSGAGAISGMTSGRRNAGHCWAYAGKPERNPANSAVWAHESLTWGPFIGGRKTARIGSMTTADELPLTARKRSFALQSSDGKVCPEADQRTPDRHGLFFCRVANQR